MTYSFETINLVNLNEVLQCETMYQLQNYF